MSGSPHTKPAQLDPVAEFTQNQFNRLNPLLMELAQAPQQGGAARRTRSADLLDCLCCCTNNCAPKAAICMCPVMFYFAISSSVNCLSKDSSCSKVAPPTATPTPTSTPSVYYTPSASFLYAEASSLRRRTTHQPMQQHM